MAPTQLDIDAAAAMVAAMLEVGVSATITPPAGAGTFDPATGGMSEQPVEGVPFTTTPILGVSIDLVGASATGLTDKDSVVTDTDSMVIVSGADVVASTLDKIPLLGTVRVGSFIGTIVKTKPIYSGTLIAAWKVVLRG